jgi:hypothetical protein
MSWTKKKTKEETLPKIFNNYLELTAAIQQQKKSSEIGRSSSIAKSATDVGSAEGW